MKLSSNKNYMLKTNNLSVSISDALSAIKTHRKEQKKEYRRNLNERLETMPEEYKPDRNYADNPY